MNHAECPAASGFFNSLLGVGFGVLAIITFVPEVVLWLPRLVLQ